MNPILIQAIIGSLVRWVFTAVGASAAVVGEDEITQSTGAITALVALGWSIYQKKKAL